MSEAFLISIKRSPRVRSRNEFQSYRPSPHLRSADCNKPSLPFARNCIIRARICFRPP